MLLTNVKTGATVAILFSLLGCNAWAVGQPRSGQASAKMPGPRPAQASSASQPKSEKSRDPKATITYQGRVLDPAGRPVTGAALYLYTYRLEQPKDPPVRATSGADGRFRFEVAKSDFDSTYEVAPWSFSTVVARAKSYAFGLANDRGDAKELTLQLIADDVPISGRLIDLEGRPVAGVTVKVLNVRAPDKPSLDDWLKALEERKALYRVERAFLPIRLEVQSELSVMAPVTTGPDGTFRIEGIGRERVATLQLEGPAIETKQVEVRTRPGATIRVPGYEGRADLIPIYGASFEHVAGPTRPIEGVVRDQDTGKPLAGVIVHGERALGNALVFTHAITDSQGKYRLVGLPRGKEGPVLAVPPCDFPVFGARKAAPNVPREEDLPYLRARVAVEETRGTDPLHLDISMKRGVWVTGRVVDEATGKPVDARLEYLVYNDNPHFKAFQTPRTSYARMSPRFVGKDGSFHLVAFPGPGLLAARTAGNRYALAAGADTLTHRPDGRLLPTEPYPVAPGGYHVLAEIDPAPGTVSLTRDLALETGRSLSVTVLGPDGKALADTHVKGLNEMVRYFATPGTSTFTVNGLKPGTERSLTLVNEKARVSGELVLHGGETGPRTVTLRPWATLSGRVVDNDGAALTEGYLYSIDLPSGMPKVGKDGRFRAEGLVPGKPYTIHFIQGQGRTGGIIARDVKVGPGEVKDLGDVVLQQPKRQ